MIDFFEKNSTENQQGLKITKDAIAYAPSGLVDHDKNIALSYLHKAIRPANQLRMMENAVVIYRITRAPERRIFYVDVGNLPKMKAEQYMKDIMDRYRNKLVYDANTGEIRDDKKFMSMLEDFWLPRREGGTGTSIDTLPAGQNLGQIEDVEYFQRKLYQSLNIPVSRLEQQAGLNFGRAAEINRDEMKFTKFIIKLRRKFSVMLSDLLHTQLLLKGVITEEDWQDIKDDLDFEFATDAYYTESKEQEILRERLDALSTASEYVGKYFSQEYVRKYILRQTEEEIKDIDAQIKQEKEDGVGQDDQDGFYNSNELGDFEGWCDDGGCSIGFSMITESNDDHQNSKLQQNDSMFYLEQNESLTGSLNPGNVASVQSDSTNDSYQKSAKRSEMDQAYEKMMDSRR